MTLSRQNIEQQLHEMLAPLGLAQFGWFELVSGPPELDGQPAMLIGNRGPAMWKVFSASKFANDGKPDPLDRWTRSVVQPVADQLNARALYPFLSKPDRDHWPFQRWAHAGMGLKQSPPGLLIDPEYGLWHAFRAALVFEIITNLPKQKPTIHPCDECANKPCLTTCPVNAISAKTFDVTRCIAHVNSKRGNPCREKGCIARNACPVGRIHAYGDDQQTFHMRAYSNS